MKYKIARRFRGSNQPEDVRFEPYYSTDPKRILDAHTEMASRELVRLLRDGNVSRTEFFAVMRDLQNLSVEGISVVRPGVSLGVDVGPYRYVIESANKKGEGVKV